MAVATMVKGVLATDGSGLEDTVFSFRSAGGSSNPNRVRDGRPKTAGISVTRAAAGEYEVQLPLVGGGYPSQICGIICQLGFVDVSAFTTNIGVDVAYKADSYSASTGKFRILATKDDGSPAAEDLAANIEVHVHVRFRRDTVLKQA